MPTYLSFLTGPHSANPGTMRPAPSVATQVSAKRSPSRRAGSSARAFSVRMDGPPMRQKTARATTRRDRPAIVRDEVQLMDVLDVDEPGPPSRTDWPGTGHGRHELDHSTVL